jgi:DNA-binding transcriptional MerR regulator
MPDALPTPDVPRGTLLPIGGLARATGVKPTTIRWYEDAGLLPPPARSKGGHRLYGPGHVARLAFLRHAREMGFPLGAIRSLLDLSGQPGRDCGGAHALAVAQLAEVEVRLARLAALRDELRRLVDLGCESGAAAECRVLEVLADHRHGRCADPLHATPGAGLA